MGKTLPIKDIETINNIRSLYSKQENYRDLLLFLLSINSGANLTDLLNLNVGDVRNKHYFVFKDKCSIPFTEEIKNTIQIAISNRNNKDPLFVTSKNTRLDRTWLFSKFKDLRDELGLGNEISISSFRKTFGYFHYQKYRDLSFLQWLFNQCTVEQTLAYIDVKENMSLRYKEGVSL